MLTITSFRPAGSSSEPASDYVTLAHDQRHLRRKLLHLQNDEMIMLDLKAAVLFANGDILVAENGDLIEVRAAKEKLYEVIAQDAQHLIELAWHLGNRHLTAQITVTRILIQRDHVIRAMLEGLGAMVNEVDEPFQPVRGAYHTQSAHNHSHGHDHSNCGHHDHSNCSHD